MNGIKVDNDGSTGVLTLEGDMTIARMSDIREALMDMLAKSDDLLLDLSGLESTDMTLLQIICSAHHTAERLKKSFFCKGAPSEAVSRIAETSGFQRHKACIETKMSGCLWLDENGSHE
jgi:anti-anti-sigma factor